MQGNNGLGPRWLDENRKFRDVVLTSPIREAGQDLTTVRIREPVVLDLEDIALDSFEKPILFLRAVLAKCAGVSDVAVRTMTAPDFVRCAEALAELGFRSEQVYGLLALQLESSLATGRIGSVSLPSASDSGSANSG